jgi:hypothetical protein
MAPENLSQTALQAIAQYGLPQARWCGDPKAGLHQAIGSDKDRA